MTTKPTSADGDHTLAISVAMPSLGEQATEGTLVKWLKSPGDAVAAGEPIAEVVTDKVSAEVASPVTGRLGSLLVPPGVTVATGTTIVTVVPSVGHSSTGSAGLPSGSPASSEQVVEEPADTLTRTSPLVRRLAQENGIDLRHVPATGQGGRVTKDDILSFISSRSQATTLADAPAAQAGRVPGIVDVAHSSHVPNPSQDAPDDHYVLPPSALRQAIAAHLVRSVRTIPQAWTLVEVDVSGLLAWRQAQREGFRSRHGVDVSVFALFAHTVVGVLSRHPLLNATWNDGPDGPDARGAGGGRVTVHRRINLGVAVARPGGGLLVPCVPDAGRLSVSGLAGEMRRIIDGSRENTLGSSAYAGTTMTINNTGALGSVTSQPILPEGTSAILTLEAITRRPVVVGNDAIAIRPMANLCLTFDHRVLDGQEACAFLQELKSELERLSSTTAIH